MIAEVGYRGRSFQKQIALAPSDDIEYVSGLHLRWVMPAEYAIRKADSRTMTCQRGMARALYSAGLATFISCSIQHPRPFPFKYGGSVARVPFGATPPASSWTPKT
jgi:hypothetical protein